MPHNTPAIPDVPVDHSAKEILQPIKETVEVMTGVRKSGARKTDAVPTWQDLVDLGLITAEQVPR